MIEKEADTIGCSPFFGETAPNPDSSPDDVPSELWRAASVTGHMAYDFLLLQRTRTPKTSSALPFIGASHSALFLLLTFGCGSTTPDVAADEVTDEVTAEATEAESRAEGSEEPASEPSLPVFDVHEWGLIDASMHRRDIEVAAGPGHLDALARRTTMQGYGKPVLYFHVESPTDAPFAVRVGVQLPEALTIAEHYPPATERRVNPSGGETGVIEHGMDGHGAGDIGDRRPDGPATRELIWQGQLRSGGCEGVRTYPSVESAYCQGIADGYCETSELADYETADGDCLMVDDEQGSEGTPWPLLFYRGGSAVGEDGQPLPFAHLPLVVSREARRQIRVERASDVLSGGEAVNGGTIGRLWRIRRTPGGVAVASAPWPSVGEDIRLPAPTGSDELQAAREAIGDDLRAHGLRPSEIEAFQRAWQETLFGSEGTGTVTGSGRGGLVAAPPSDVLLYWMPQSAITHLSTLTFEPAARHIRRAAMIRVNLLR